MLSNSEDTSCNDSIKVKNDFRPVLIACCITGAVSALMCILAIALIVRLRMYKSLTNRIVLYLLVAVLFYCLTTVFGISALWHNYWKGEHYKLCVVEGFLNGYSSLVLFFSTLMVTLHLTIMVLFTSSYEKITKRTCCTCTILDAFYLLFSWILSLIIAWIPFVHNNYGLSGLWCWIRMYNDNCSWNEKGMLEVYGTDYGELILGLSLNNFVLFVVVVTLCKRSCYNTFSLEYRKVLKQILPLIIFPIIYQVLNLIALINHIYQSVKSGKYLKGLFFAHGVTNSGWGFFAGLFIIIYLLTLSEFRNKVMKCIGVITTVVNLDVIEREPLSDQDLKDPSYGTMTTDPTVFIFSSESCENIEDEQIH